MERPMGPELPGGAMQTDPCPGGYNSDLHGKHPHNNLVRLVRLSEK